MKKKALLFYIILFQSALVFGQNQTYDDKDEKVLRYGEKTGVLDSAAQNPDPNDVNKVTVCAKYTRNADKKFDVLKMDFNGNLSDSSVNAFATYLGIPPKFKMKVYSSAPVGTLVEILLGSKSGNNAYPEGTHSQYQAYTTVMNKWEELEFKFSQIPKGSQTSASQIDQLTILFNPNSKTSDTYYFTEISGPVLIAKKTVEPNSKGVSTKINKSKTPQKENKKTGKTVSGTPKK